LPPDRVCHEFKPHAQLLKARLHGFNREIIKLDKLEKGRQRAPTSREIPIVEVPLLEDISKSEHGRSDGRWIANQRDKPGQLMIVVSSTSSCESQIRQTTPSVVIRQTTPGR
jgi:hypothetical protein